MNDAKGSFCLELTPKPLLHVVLNKRKCAAGTTPIRSIGSYNVCYRGCTLYKKYKRKSKYVNIKFPRATILLNKQIVARKGLLALKFKDNKVCFLLFEKDFDMLFTQGHSSGILKKGVKMES